MADHEAGAGEPGAADPTVPERTGQGHPHQIIRLLRGVSVASGQFTDAIAESHELHRTDLNALSALMDAGRQGRALSAGELAARLRLSAPATTALLDRLSRVGHVHRKRNATDRRIVDIEITPHARTMGHRLFEPMGRHVSQVIERYAPEQLELIERFLAEVLLAIEAARAESSSAGSVPGAAIGNLADHSSRVPLDPAVGPVPPQIIPSDAD